MYLRRTFNRVERSHVMKLVNVIIAEPSNMPGTGRNKQVGLNPVEGYLGV